jgi:uncharacterized protein YhbP (UPF0306 family)
VLDKSKPKSVLTWREGDKITLEMRDALVSYLAESLNLSVVEEAKTRKEYALLPEAAVAGPLAVMIATIIGMDTETFKRTFPTIARESKSLAVKAFLSHAKRKADDEPPDLGTIG